MSSDAIPLSDADMETLAKNVQKAPKVVKRNMVEGPLNGQKVIIPEDQTVNDIGWWSMTYLLQDNGTMKWSRKPEVWAKQ